VSGFGIVALLSGTMVSEGPIFLKEGMPLVLQVEGVDPLSVSSTVSTSLTSPIPRWFELHAKALDYDNTQFCDLDSTLECVAPIEWYWEEIVDVQGQTQVAVLDVVELSKPGTHRVGVFFGDPPKAEPQNGLEIVVRRDDTYVGYVSELIGVPFVFWPKKTTLGHQTDLRLAADCVATVVYGKRRMGNTVYYLAPKALTRYLEPVEAGDLKKGDVLHFGFQTAVLSQDFPPVGHLSDNDWVIHSHHGLVEEKEFHALPYSKQPHTVYRWLAIFD
jgi:hypothetical protein